MLGNKSANLYNNQDTSFSINVLYSDLREVPIRCLCKLNKTVRGCFEFPEETPRCSLMLLISNLLCLVSRPCTVFNNTSI